MSPTKVALAAIAITVTCSLASNIYMTHLLWTHGNPLSIVFGLATLLLISGTLSWAKAR